MAEFAEKLAGKFIVIDGPDGAGKSTQMAMLSEWISRQGVSVTEARDPGGTVIGDKIRDILLDRSHDGMTIGCELMLYQASRAQLMGEVIEPAIQAGRCVLCDRWVSSTVAYQGAAGVHEPGEILQIYDWAVSERYPDLTVVLDLPAENGLARLTGKPDRMEARSTEFHAKVRDSFLSQADASPERFTVVDATKPIDQVHQEIVSKIERHFAK